MFYSSTSCFSSNAYKNKCNMLIFFDAAWGFDISSLSSCRVEMIHEILCIIVQQKKGKIQIDLVS